MPLTLVPPRPGRSPFWRVRGSYLGIILDRSTRTARRGVARQILAAWEREIESGALAATRGPRFADAAHAYLLAGGEATYLRRLSEYFGDLPIGAIDQIAVDLAAAALYPDAAPATRNRSVHTPVSAVLNHAGRSLRLRRPKEGAARTRWLEPAQFELLHANLPPRLQPLAVFLVYSGCRLGETLALDWATVDLAARRAVIAPSTTKTGEGRPVHLTERMVAVLAGLAPDDGSPPAGRVFGYRTRWSVAHAWRAGAARAGLAWATPHVLRHSWATWMRRYAGASIEDLVLTRAWADRKSVLRYTHVAAEDEARRADQLPGSGGC
jgi:integrase